MEKLISKLFEMIDKNDYKNIINILTWLFMLVVPSYLWFFIYRIDLFKTLDTLKLLILCIGINSSVLGKGYSFLNVVGRRGICRIRRGFTPLN